MASVQNKNVVRSNKAQINYLCQYMAKNPNFAAGNFKTPKGAEALEREWSRLKAALDELGPNRTVEQWKVCWRDQKRKAREEGALTSKALNATGNSVSVPELSENANLILSTIGEEMAVGIGPAESPIGYSAAQAVNDSASTAAVAGPSHAPPHSPVFAPPTQPPRAETALNRRRTRV